MLAVILASTDYSHCAHSRSLALRSSSMTHVSFQEKKMQEKKMETVKCLAFSAALGRSVESTWKFRIRKKENFLREKMDSTLAIFKHLLLNLLLLTRAVIFLYAVPHSLSKENGSAIRILFKRKVVVQLELRSFLLNSLFWYVCRAASTSAIFISKVGLPVQQHHNMPQEAPFPHHESQNIWEISLFSASVFVVVYIIAASSCAFFRRRRRQQQMRRQEGVLPFLGKLSLLVLMHRITITAVQSVSRALQLSMQTMRADQSRIISEAVRNSVHNTAENTAAVAKSPIMMKTAYSHMRTMMVSSFSFLFVSNIKPSFLAWNSISKEKGFSLSPYVNRSMEPIFPLRLRSRILFAHSTTRDLPLWCSTWREKRLDVHFHLFVSDPKKQPSHVSIFPHIFLIKI